MVSMADFQAKFFPEVFTNEQVLKTGTDDPYCKYNNHVLQLIVSSLYIPAAFVSIFAASFARKTGRKVISQTISICWRRLGRSLSMYVSSYLLSSIRPPTECCIVCSCLCS